MWTLSLNLLKSWHSKNRTQSLSCPLGFAGKIKHILPSSSSLGQKQIITDQVLENKVYCKFTNSSLKNIIQLT